jgi:hypothetical protein
MAFRLSGRERSIEENEAGGEERGEEGWCIHNKTTMGIA